MLKKQNEELSAKLQKLGAVVARTKEELARYRVSDGKDPYEQMEEEELLRNRLQVRLPFLDSQRNMPGSEALIFCLHVNRKASRIEASLQKTCRACVPPF